MHNQIIAIDLPLPRKATHPNARPHWAVKAKATKANRRDAALVAKQCAPAKPWEKATVQCSFTLPRKQDADNLQAWCKAYFDGLQDGGIITNDSGLTHLPVTQTTGKGLRYGVVITIETI
jgi:crossover junction endodeoxyribonuclease RusA